MRKLVKAASLTPAELAANTILAIEQGSYDQYLKTLRGALTARIDILDGAEPRRYPLKPLLKSELDRFRKMHRDARMEDAKRQLDATVPEGTLTRQYLHRTGQSFWVLRDKALEPVPLHMQDMSRMVRFENADYRAGDLIGSMVEVTHSLPHLNTEVVRIIDVKRVNVDVQFQTKPNFPSSRITAAEQAILNGRTVRISMRSIRHVFG